MRTKLHSFCTLIYPTSWFFIFNFSFLIFNSLVARRIKLTLEYDGTDFSGWQVQSGADAGEDSGSSARTVQGEVERALRAATGAPIRIAGASRTDSGVHARGQTASLLLPEEVTIPTDELCQALNGNMQ